MISPELRQLRLQTIRRIAEGDDASPSKSAAAPVSQWSRRRWGMLPSTPSREGRHPALANRMFTTLRSSS